LTAAWPRTSTTRSASRRRALDRLAAHGAERDVIAMAVAAIGSEGDHHVGRQALERLREALHSLGVLARERAVPELEETWGHDTEHAAGLLELGAS
jgi:hypothetical protein